MTKEIPMTNQPTAQATLPIRLSGFVIASTFALRHSSLILFLFACLGGGFATARLSASEPSTFPPPAATHGGASVPASLPPAPPAASSAVVSSEVASSAVTNSAPTPNSQLPTPASPPATRTLDADELTTLLTATLQQEIVKTKGDLELRLTRPWPRLPVPAAPLTLKITELPATGLSASSIIRFELWAEEQRGASSEGATSATTPHARHPTPAKKLGEWQAVVQARIWREIWVARTQLKRGEPVASADLGRERRDIIHLREAVAEFSAGEASLELAEPLGNGAPVLARSVRLKPVIHRGQLADAYLEDGALRVSLKVEALEDGAPGQVIRTRNPQTRRDLRGQVLTDQTIRLTL